MKEANSEEFIESNEKKQTPFNDHLTGADDSDISLDRNHLNSVFIVDDDEITTYLTSRIIDEIKFCNKYETFLSGPATLERLKEMLENNIKVPDMMLVDINMPCMNGWDFLNELASLKLEKPIPVFMFTAFFDDFDYKKFSTYPAIMGHIQKPLTVIKLNKILRLLS